MSAEVSPLWVGEETLVPAALRGYRSWKVVDARLRSTGVSHVWDAPEIAARCLAPSVGGGSDPDCPCDLCARNTHPSPLRDCVCGIYGWYNPADRRLVEGDVFGAVEATGRVVLASHGFRAERVRMLALAIEPPDYFASMTLSFSMNTPPSGDDLHTVARWAKEHGVPVFPTKAEMLEEFPPEDVSSLVQHDCTETCKAHPQYESRYAALRHNFALSSGTISYTHTGGSPWVTLGETGKTADDPPRPRLYRWQYPVLLLWSSLIGLVLGLYSTVRSGPSVLASVGVVCNAALTGFWAWCLIRRRRASAVESSDVEEES